MYAIFKTVTNELSGSPSKEIELLSPKSALVVFSKKNPYSQLHVYGKSLGPVDPSFAEGPTIKRSISAKAVKDFPAAKAILDTIWSGIPWAFDRFLCHKLPSVDDVGGAGVVEILLEKTTVLCTDVFTPDTLFTYQLKSYIKMHHVEDRN